MFFSTKDHFFVVPRLLAIALFMFAMAAAMPTFAQEETTEESSEGGVVIAATSVTNVEIISQEGHELVIGFTLTNNFHKVESPIKYSVQLITQTLESDGGMRNFVNDEHVYDDEVTLNPGQSVYREVTYTVPPPFSGEFGVAISAENPNGIPYSTVPADETIVVKTERGVLFDLGLCHLEVEGEEEPHSLSAGVDITPQEGLALVCEGALNKEMSQEQFTPQVTLKKRTKFGEELDEYPLEPVTIKPGASKNISLALQTPEEPQAYTAEVVFSDGSGNVVSNTVPAHFVVSGESGTIQSLQIDKTTYEAGEKAEVTFGISGRADMFPGSRAFGEDLSDTGTIPAQYSVDIAIQDGENWELCGSKKDNTVDLMDINSPVSVVDITNDCQIPVVTATLFDADGTELDREMVRFEPSEDMPKKSTDVDNDNKELAADDADAGGKATVFIVGAVVLILVALTVFLLFMRSRSGQQNVKTFMFILILMGGVFTATDSVLADSKTLKMDSPWSAAGVAPVYEYAYFSSSDDNIECGDTIDVTIENVIDICSNTNDRFEMKSKVDGRSFTSACDGGSGCRDDTSSKTYTMNTNSNPGGHDFDISAKFYIVGKDFEDSDSSSLDYNTTCGNPNAWLNVYQNGESVTAIDYNEKVELRWSSQDVNDCTATQGPGFSTGSGNPTSGSDDSSPLTDTSQRVMFEVSCTGPFGGASDTDGVWVRRAAECGPADGEDSYATEEELRSAGLCSIGNDLAVSGGSGSDWTWTCEGINGGNNASCTAPSVPDPIVTLTNDGPIDYGTTATLTWEVTNADESEVDSCEATGGPWSGSKEVPGQGEQRTEETIELRRDTDFAITCTNPYNRSGSDDTTVEVMMRDMELNIDDHPDPTQTGGSYDLEWDARYADRCEVDMRTRVSAADGSYGAYPSEYGNTLYTSTADLTDIGDDFIEDSAVRTDTAPDGRDQQYDWRLSCTNQDGVTAEATTEHTVWGRPDPTLYICDAGGTGCTQGTKEIQFDQTATVVWETEGSAENCNVIQGSSAGFSTGEGDTTEGSADVNPAAPDETETFQIVCDGRGGIKDSNEVHLYTQPLPHLETDDHSVQTGEEVDIRWFTTGDDPNNCIITTETGEVLYSTTTDPTLVQTAPEFNTDNEDDDPYNGQFSPTINTTTTFNLSCPSGDHSITIFAQPVIHET